MAFADTPQVHDMDSSHIAGPDFDRSAVSPVKRAQNLPRQTRGDQGKRLQTPSLRHPLTERHNLRAATSEFTPLLKSAAKRNILSAHRRRALQPQTPAFLRNGYRPSESSVIEAPENSILLQERSPSYLLQADETPVLPTGASTQESTPLARDSLGNDLLDGGNKPKSLREQEQTLNRVEKENFALKLKIHFLEEMLNKSDPNMQSKAVQENLELKIDRASLTRELKQMKMKFVKVEKDLTECRTAAEKLQKAGDSAGRSEALHATEAGRNQKAAEAANKTVERLELDLEAYKNKVEEMANANEDLEHSLRQKIRELDAKHEELEDLESARSKVEQLEQELAESRNDEEKKLDLEEELQEQRSVVRQLQAEILQTRGDFAEAVQERQEALVSLERLQAKAAEKSLTGRELEQAAEVRVKSVEKDLVSLRADYDNIQQQHEQKCIEARRLQDELKGLRSAHKSSSQQLSRSVEANLAKDEECEVLRSRHEVLMQESEGLQREVAQLRDDVRHLRKDLDVKHRERNDENAVRIASEQAAEKLKSQISTLQRALEQERSHFTNDETRWERRMRELEEQKRLALQERDEKKSLLERLQDSRRSASSEKERVVAALELRTDHAEKGNATLKGQIEQLRSENRDLRDQQHQNDAKCGRLQGELEDANANVEESAQEIQRLENAVAGLEQAIDERKNSNATIPEERLAEVEKLTSEAQELRRKVQELESSRQRLEDDLRRAKTGSTIPAVERLNGPDEIALLENELEKMRKNEINFLKEQYSSREASRKLKDRVANLEKELHETKLNNLVASSPRLHLTSSTDAEELNQARRRVEDSIQQVKTLKNENRRLVQEREHETIAARENIAHQLAELEKQHERDEGTIADLRLSEKRLQMKLDGAERTVARLNSRLSSLDSRRKLEQIQELEDLTMAEERRDLHGLLKDAKLEAKDLQLQVKVLQQKQEKTKKYGTELKEQHAKALEEVQQQRRKVRESAGEARALRSKIEDLGRRGKQWEEEKNAILTRVRFPDMSVSDIRHDPKAWAELEAELARRTKQHHNELRGLAKQIHWLRAKCQREEDFRVGLAYEKRFLVLQIEMLQSCNYADLRLLEEMGLTPDKYTRERRPTLRAVAWTLIAGMRMRKKQQNWAVLRQSHASLVKKAEQLRRGTRKSGVQR